MAENQNDRISGEKLERLGKMKGLVEIIVSRLYSPYGPSGYFRRVTGGSCINGGLGVRLRHQLVRRATGR